MTSPYDRDLDRNAANFQPLSPLSFLERSAAVHPEKVAVVHGAARLTYKAFYARCRQLASALTRRGIGKGDTVAAMLANTPPMLEAHYGVPMSGAVLLSMNTRLDAAILAFQLDHSETKVLICDREFAPVMREALALARVKPLVIDFNDLEFPQSTPAISDLDYEAFVASGDAAFAWSLPADEWQSLTLNYTSGTTGNPKGVVYSHRGAALMCYANTVTANLGRHPVYLWTLPMFHCNGWCFPWTL
ncbi:MAG: acyl-CoA synthetase, partial [Hyphomicrobiales bacterium]